MWAPGSDAEKTYKRKIAMNTRTNAQTTGNDLNNTAKQA